MSQGRAAACRFRSTWSGRRRAMAKEVLQQRLDAVARARLEAAWPQVAYSLRQIAVGNPLGSEPSEARAVARLVKLGVDTRQAEAMAVTIQNTATGVGK